MSAARISPVNPVTGPVKLNRCANQGNVVPTTTPVNKTVSNPPTQLSVAGGVVVETLS